MWKLNSGAILTVTLLLVSFAMYAQDYPELALQFGRTKPGGSARIQGMGGAQTALGGDYSSALSNPAGLGIYNRSEFAITPGFTAANADAIYSGQKSDDSRSVLNLSGLALVINSPKENRGFLGGSFAITMSRTNDFNNAILYRGTGTSSIAHHFVDRALGHFTDEFDVDGYYYNDLLGLAYHNYLIGPQSILDPPGFDDEYFTDVPIDPFQRENIETKGASNQWSISYGGNFEDKFFFGAGLGITTLRYSTSRMYTEAFDDQIFNGLTIEENLQTRGSGVNLSLGMIGRPVDFLQIGVSYVTPTLYGLTETYDASLSSSWNGFDYYGDGSTILNEESAYTDENIFEYGLTVPSRFNAGLALISRFGLLTGDIELTNPGRLKYESSMDPSISETNDQIKAVFRQVLNLRIGAEYRHNIFRARAGYGLQGNTVREQLNQNNKIQSFSIGGGIRMKNFYADLAIVHSRGKQLYSPYTFNVYDFENPVVNITNKLTSAVLTIGFTFADY